MRFAHRVGLAAGAVAAVVVLAGCGTSSGSLLTQGAAAQLTAELNQATTALDDYNCQVAYQAVTNFSADVNQLTGVNATLVKMLSDGASRISILANARCPSGISSDTTTSPSTETTTTGTQTTSTSVTTTSPATTTTSDTSSDSGGAAPTTLSTPTVGTTPPVTTATQPATTPDSGGAGLNGSGAGSNGGTGVGGATGQ